ncbi:MAG: hypothetical protein ACKOZU_12800 [Planctomycetaceae bacterium]
MHRDLHDLADVGRGRRRVGLAPAGDHGVQEVDTEPADGVLLQGVRGIQEPHVDDHVARLRAERVLEADAQPRVAFVAQSPRDWNPAGGSTGQSGCEATGPRVGSRVRIKCDPYDTEQDGFSEIRNVSGM